MHAFCFAPSAADHVALPRQHTAAPHFVQRWLIALLLSMHAVAAPLHAQTLGPQLVAMPANATALGTVTVTGDRLLVGGDYRVVLVVAANDRRTLATVIDGDGEFTRTVTTPSIAAGTYTMELTVNSTVRDTVSFRVLPPLAITLTPASPRAGTTVNFSVSGLTTGSLTLSYAGRTSFGPVSVRGGTYSGRMRIPTDRPPSLPASVVISVANGTGRLLSRRGSRTVTVQPAITRPFARIQTATPSTTTPSRRLPFRITGNVETNDALASEVDVDAFWTTSSGQTLPMGSIASQIEADGDFATDLRTPQIGTNSAMEVVSPGSIRARTAYIDPNGLKQFQIDESRDDMSIDDVDPAIDINIVLFGPDGERINGARVDIHAFDPGDSLDDLHPPNGNTGFVQIDGKRVRVSVTQFTPSDVTYQYGTCPDTIERKFTDANGRAEFEFDLAVPPGQTNTGNGDFPISMGIPDVNACSTEAGATNQCDFADTDPIGFKMRVYGAPAGYGYRENFVTAQGQIETREVPLIIDAEVNRVTGRIKLTYQPPGASQAASIVYPNGSANLQLTLPRQSTLLALGEPSLFARDDSESPILSTREDSGRVVFKSIVDFTAFAVGPDFTPAAPAPRRMEFRYNAGARPALQSATFNIFRNGTAQTVPFVRVSGNYDCESDANAEGWQVDLPPIISHGLRFPGLVFNGNNGRLTAAKKVYGYIRAVDVLGGVGVVPFVLQFEPLTGVVSTLPLDRQISVDARDPHMRKVTFGSTAINDQVDSPAAPPRYNLPAKRSRVTGGTAYEFCVPEGTSCGAVAAVDFDHQQFSKDPQSQPANAGGSGGSVINESTGSSSNPWEELFNYTVPLFRWYWGVPELLSAEVYADLVVKAEYLFNARFNPLDPANASTVTGGRFNVGVFIGVDIDVLFGILIDAGAAIYGGVVAQVVTTADLDSASAEKCLRFILNFSGWLEIGCPFPNPIDPTCYIPNIEETFPILSSDPVPAGCTFDTNLALAQSHPKLGVTGKPLLSFETPVAGVAGAPTPQGGATLIPRVLPFPRDMRRALHRSPTLAFDGAGNSLTLYLDDRGRLVSREGLRDPEPTRIVRTAYGIRDVAVAYHTTDRAVAVWAESSMPEVPIGAPPPTPTRDSAAAAQRLFYALYDGSVWATPVALTAPGSGEGQVKLARCQSTLLTLRTGCAEKVSLVFQRNTDGTVGGEKHIFFAQFDGRRWTAPTRVDETGLRNITPALTYAGGEPVVAWVRYTPGCTSSPVTPPAGSPPVPPLGYTNCRTLAMRVMDGRGREMIGVGGGARGVAQPSIAGKPNGQIAIAYTQASSASFVGARQALHLGQRSCAITDTCAFTTWQVQDHRGRRLYVERPKANFNSTGDLVTTFRGLGFGPVPGIADPDNNLFDDDPVGIRASVGELMDFVTPLQPSFVRTRALTADAGVHFQPFAAFDPSSNEVVGVSVTLESTQREALSANSSGVESRALAQTFGLDDGISVAMIGDAADLFVESLTTTAPRLDPGTSIPVRIEVANRGSAWVTDAEQTARVRFWWDTPQTRTVTSASFNVGNIAAGAKLVQTVLVPVPTAFANDQRQSLRVAIEVEGETGEIDGDNNEATVQVGGMPIPQSVLAHSAAGTRAVNLVWAAPTDARIAGYRVYVDDASGTPRPLGSSFNKGWVDLTALYGFKRTYRVSTYSANGVESELSAPVTAEPAPLALSAALFADGFEVQTP